MADWRGISQGYAQGAISAAILINGGAAVAVLSQLSELAKLELKTEAACAIMLWVIGTGLGAILWGLAFASTRHVDRSERVKEPASGGPELVKADKYMIATVICFCFSIVFFIGGSLPLLIHIF